jgi:hypothetical protein
MDEVKKRLAAAGFKLIRRDRAHGQTAYICTPTSDADPATAADKLASAGFKVLSEDRGHYEIEETA